MNYKIPCEIIQDLLPSYVDGITNTVSNETINEHVKECQKCARILSDMQEEPGSFSSVESNNREIDYLKKVKRKNRIRVVVIAFAAILLIGCVIGLFRRIYGGSYLLNNIDYSVEVNGSDISVTGTIPDGFVYDYSEFTFEDGTFILTVSCEPETILNQSADHKLDLSFRGASEDITTVQINGVILWQDDVEIDEAVAATYSTKHAYIGDAPANSSTAYNLGIEDYFGKFTSELQTAHEPYDWKLVLANPLPDSEEKMKAYSCAILPLIDNLGSVTWEHGTKQYTVTTEDATEYVGSDIKSYGKTAKDYQKLMEKIGLTPGYRF